MAIEVVRSCYTCPLIGSLTFKHHLLHNNVLSHETPEQIGGHKWTEEHFLLRAPKHARSRRRTEIRGFTPKGHGAKLDFDTEGPGSPSGTGDEIPQTKSGGATDKDTVTVVMQGSTALKSLTGADIRQFRQDGELQFLKDQTSFIELIQKDADRHVDNFQLLVKGLSSGANRFGPWREVLVSEFEQFISPA